jgi:hypothetical protein
VDLRQRVAAAREGFARLTAARGALQASLQAPLVDLANHAYDTALATNKTFKDKLNVGFCFFFLLSLAVVGLRRRLCAVAAAHLFSVGNRCSQA